MHNLSIITEYIMCFIGLVGIFYFLIKLVEYIFGVVLYLKMRFRLKRNLLLSTLRIPEINGNVSAVDIQDLGCNGLIDFYPQKGFYYELNESFFNEFKKARIDLNKMSVTINAGYFYRVVEFLKRIEKIQNSTMVIAKLPNKQTVYYRLFFDTYDDMKKYLDKQQEGNTEIQK